jgi:hypothetical protein
MSVMTVYRQGASVPGTAPFYIAYVARYAANRAKISCVKGQPAGGRRNSQRHQSLRQ